MCIYSRCVLAGTKQYIEYLKYVCNNYDGSINEHFICLWNTHGENNNNNNINKS